MKITKTFNSSQQKGKLTTAPAAINSESHSCSQGAAQVNQHWNNLSSTMHWNRWFISICVKKKSKEMKASCVVKQMHPHQMHWSLNALMNHCNLFCDLLQVFWFLEDLHIHGSTPLYTTAFRFGSCQTKCYETNPSRGMTPLLLLWLPCEGGHRRAVLIFTLLCL